MVEDFSLEDEVSVDKLCVLFLQVMTGHERCLKEPCV